MFPGIGPARFNYHFQGQRYYIFFIFQNFLHFFVYFFSFSIKKGREHSQPSKKIMFFTFRHPLPIRTSLGYSVTSPFGHIYFHKPARPLIGNSTTLRGSLNTHRYNPSSVVSMESRCTSPRICPGGCVCGYLLAPEHISMSPR